MNFQINNQTTEKFDALAMGHSFDTIAKLCRKSGMDKHETASTATYLKRFKAGDTELCLQSLSADDMALAYTGNAWAWVDFEMRRSDVAYHYTKDGDTPYNGGYWERYTVAHRNVHGDHVDDLIMFPVFYTQLGEVHVINGMNWTDVRISENAFAVFVTIMTMTLVAEKWYEKEQKTGMMFYMMRDTVIQAMRDGALYGLSEDDVNAIHRLID